MAKSCFNGCSAGFKGCFRGLHPLIHGTDAFLTEAPANAELHWQSPAQSAALSLGKDEPIVLAAVELAAAEELAEEELTQMALPEAAPEMVPEAELPVEKLPTLLTSKAMVRAPQDDKGKEPEEKEELSLLTTAYNSADVSAASTPVKPFGCCTDHAALDVLEWPAEQLWEVSSKVGHAAWHGSLQVASFLSQQLHVAAQLAKPHVESLANSAAQALRPDTKRELLPMPKSTWEANHKRAGLTPPNLAAVMPDLAQYDVCQRTSLASAPCPPPRMWNSCQMPVADRPRQAQSFPALAGYDPSRDARLRYSMGVPPSQSFAGAPGVNMVPHLTPASSFRSDVPRLPYASSFQSGASFAAPPLASSFREVHQFQQGISSGFEPVAHSQAKILGTKLGERRPLSEARIRPYVQPQQDVTNS